MGEVVYFDAAARRSAFPPSRQTQQVPYETYVAYQQAERAFKALYFGMPFDTAEVGKSASVRIEERHWPTVQQMAETLLSDKSLSRAQVLKLLLQRSHSMRRDDPGNCAAPATAPAFPPRLPPSGASSPPCRRQGSRRGGGWSFW
jgi:hypothetical protein